MRLILRLGDRRADRPECAAFWTTSSISARSGCSAPPCWPGSVHRSSFTTV